MLQPQDSRKTAPHYRMADIPSPVLAGGALHMFVKLLETSQLARKSIMKLNHMDLLRGQALAETPSLLPFPPQAMFDLEMKKQSEQTEDIHPGPAVQDFLDRYQSRARTPSDVAESVLRNIQASNEGPEPLRAIIEVQAERLRTEARASSRRYEQGQPLSSLDGIPVAIKSEFFVDDHTSRAGTSFLQVPAGHPEATLVSRLRQAGALIVGVTNMHEIGIGVTGANVHQGVARNPFDKKRHTGGSSSGSAAAVAAGLVPIAIGADGGGSVRIPSSLCGVVGLKPTFFRVSSYGSFPSTVSLCQPGPIADNVRDCALAYQIIAGADPLDSMTRLQPPPSLRQISQVDDLSGLTAGIYSPWFEHADPDVVAVCHDVLMGLQKRGLKLVEIEIPELEEARVAHFCTIAAEMFSYMKPYLSSHRAELTPTTRFALSLGSEVSASDYIQAQRVRQRTMNHLEAIFKNVDFIASPVCATTAPPISVQEVHGDVLDTVLMGRLMRFVQLFNLTGNPGISFPAGYTSQGLPVGIQFAARWWAEADLLRVAYAGEGLVERRRPQAYWSPFE
ncbi:MAG TPA: amidase [Oligoflexus sp.]|uniref:amidase n=1 Tax=Oligoflexus sp. TaxID=1971216 RepID=UPI002D26F6F8|nr:amidase [Oligoflexus sp.]HYX33495.1 amidase [Oligoflexus sp.]